MTSTVTFVGAKGGVGTSTIAALDAIQRARVGRPVRLTSTDPSGIDDLAALLGVPTPEEGQAVVVLPGLTLADYLCPDSDNVVDGGTDGFSDHQGSVYVVLRNDYLSLRRALNVPQTTVGFVLVTEAQRSLTRRDVTDVLDRPVVAELAIDPALARSVDAGLLTTARHLRLNPVLPDRTCPAR